MNSSTSSAAATTTATATATTTTATTTRPFTNPPQPSRPITPVPQLHHYPSQQQPQSHPHPTTTTTTRISNPNPNSSNLHYPKPHETHPPQPIIYPLASSGRGIIPKPIRPQPPDQNLTVANPAAAFPPRSIVSFPHHQVRPFGFSSNSDSLNHPLHLMRPPHLQQSHIGAAGNAGSAPSKGIPVSAHLKVASSPSSMPDCNGYKDLRDRSRDDTFVTVQDRKVRISDGASLYALCRSWLRNGLLEENQPQYDDSAKSLPRPLPMPVMDTHLPKRKEGEEEEEDEEGEGSVEHLSAQDLLQRHIKRAKRVRARLREVRLQRIARYKTRLATLLPPPVEQFRDDAAAGN